MGRLKNIARNEVELERLGLKKAPRSKGKTKILLSRKRRVVPNVRRKPAAPKRTSRRLRGLDTSGRRLPPLPTPKRKKMNHTGEVVVPEWAEKILAGKRVSRMKPPRWFWNRAKTHQHLELSKSKFRVATIGCAGYGASLAASRGGVDGSWEFSVKVLKVGVGGFAVGLASASFQKPFKSIGKHPFSWVYHSTGSFWHNKKDLIQWGAPYGEGDKIQVKLSGGTALFFLNGKKQGSCAITGKEFLPAIQPYMGGVGELH